MDKVFKTILFYIVFIGFVQVGNGQELAFPGAEGFGKYTSGGRGGEVLVVQNLDDNGPGSLREAINQQGPRIIVFAVDGTIHLDSQLVVRNGDLTMAGQSAPGEGICLSNYSLKIEADNIIIRYIRSRLGDKTRHQDDAISILRNKDIIIDHCSFSWAIDENASFYDNENFTLQWSIISESLNDSYHEKGEHGYGGIWGGKSATFHHNILAHNKSRNPRFNGERTTPGKVENVDFRNNIIFNWKSNSAYAGEKGNYNLINNYYKYGPATEKNKRNVILNPWPPYGKFYLNGNFVFGYPEITENNFLGINSEEPEKAVSETPFEFSPVSTSTAVEAFSTVLEKAGASYKRDKVDSRIVLEIKKGKARSGKDKNGIINSQEDVGGWPNLKRGKCAEDQDKDGIPDEWELAKGLDPKDSSDASNVNLHDYYTNIEIYLNELVNE